MYYDDPPLTHGECWKIFTLGCGIFATLTALGVAAGRIMPVKQVVEQEVVKIEKVKRVVVPVPPDRTYPPLVDPKEACKGAPVVIENLLVSGSQEDDGVSYTWLDVRPAGDDYTVQCYMKGDSSNLIAEGDLISLVGGKIAGLE